MPTREQVETALAGVQDPEIRRPITELGMVKDIRVEGGTVHVDVYLTVAGCPMRDEITGRVTSAVSALPGVTGVTVELDVMDEAQRKAMRARLGGPEREIPFSKPGSLTRVYLIASGKGGVGKSSVTANLAASMAVQGLSVGVVDADVYGHSIPRMLAATGAPTMVEGLIMPPTGHGVRVISMLPFKPGGVTQPVTWRGPMLHRALQQFLADVWWGDLDVLLVDLPPGTGDVAISAGQLLPNAEVVVVTTPQAAAAEVAVRAGMVAKETHQRVAGVIENMSGFPCPHCGEVVDIFGSGGGQQVATVLSRALESDVPLLGRIPFDLRLREGGDSGAPLVLAEPNAPAAEVLIGLATRLGTPTARAVGHVARAHAGQPLLMDLIATVLPLALVVGLSPLPIMPSVALLMTPNARRNSAAYLGAWVGTLAIVTALAMAVAGVRNPGPASDEGVAWVQLATGLVFLGLALVKWLSRPEPGTPAASPAWMAALDSYTPARSARLGALLAGANPKNLLLALAAGAEIAILTTGPGQAALSVVCFVLVGSIGAGTPVIAHRMLGDRAAPVLERWKRWLEQHSTSLVVGLLVVLGTLLVVEGVPTAL